MTGIQDTGPTAPEPFPGGADPTFAAASRDELGNFGTTIIAEATIDAPTQLTCTRRGYG
jgi:hypothetical protein